VLDDAPVLEHDGMRRDLGEHGEVVRDEHERHAVPRDEAGEQFEHLGLDRHVEAVVGSSAISRRGGRRGPSRSRRAGADRRRAGAGSGARSAPVGQVHALRLGDRARRGIPPTEALVDAHRLGDLAPDGADRVERRARLLEDDADLIAAQSRELAVGQADQLALVQRMLPVAVAASGRRPRIASAVRTCPTPTRR
jgi:hypothetical protein